MWVSAASFDDPLTVGAKAVVVVYAEEEAPGLIWPKHERAFFSR